MPLAQPTKAALIQELDSLKRKIAQLERSARKRRKLQQALREQGKLCRLVTETASDAVFTIDQDSKILLVNRAAEKLFGYSTAQMQGKKITMLIPSSSRRRYEEALKRFLSANRKPGSIDPIEVVGLHKNGTDVPLEISFGYVSDQDKQLVTGIVRDISKRKRAEQALRQSEARLRMVVSGAPIILWALDSQGIFTLSEGKALKSLGLKPGEVTGKSVFEVYKDVPEILKNVRRALSGESFTSVVEVNGVTFENKYSAIKDARGRVTGVVGVATDISDYKRAEEAKRQSEMRYQDLFDNSPDIYVILDPHGTVQGFNRRGLKKLGFELKEILGKPFGQFVVPEDHEKLTKAIAQMHKTGAPPKCMEVRLRHKSGEIVWASEEFSLLKDIDGKLQSIRVVCRDITETKNLQEILARAQRLETAGRVAGQIAHDFNNLLSPLAAYPPLIRESLPRNKKVLEMLDEMEFATDKISEINQQLLALGRRGHYTVEPIDLNALVHQVVSSQAFFRDIRIEEELANELYLVQGGAAQLTRALTNLIINAKEAMRGKGILTIRTRNTYLEKPLKGYQTVEPGKYVRLDISDTGIGIHPHIANKIFDPFFTSKKMDRMRGSGLGLSVVHGIMEDHNVYITVDSTLGQGTTFSLFFPANKVAEKEVLKKLEKSKGGNEKILVVDDDPVQRRVASVILRRLGYHVDGVESGELAVKHVKDHPQDLLILDMVMDGIDGTETYRRILEFRPDQKAIILTGYAMSNRVQDALRLGAGAFVPKPVKPNSLASAVRTELNKAGVKQTPLRPRPINRKGFTPTTG
ncbi:MAG: PAS domain S-box protein [bacterium]